MKNIYLTIFSLLFIIAGCKEEDFPVPQSSEVAADFSFEFENQGFAPENVTFTSSTLIKESISNVTYTWNFGDDNTGTGASVMHSYNEPGDYEVSLVVKSPNDLDVITKTVTVKDPAALLVDIYFIDAGSFTITQIDGASFDVPGFGTGLAYDSDNHILYFTDADNGTFNSVNPDGTDMQELVTGLSDPRDIALDVTNGMAYVVDRGANEIVAVDLSDNSISVLYDNANDGLGELPVGIDFHDGFLYVTCVEIDAEAVWKGNVDGSGITRIIDYAAGGYGYGIAVDPVNEKIYFDNTDNDEILMANLDGTGIQQITTTSNRVYGIAVDNTNSKLYWTERNSGNVYMSDLDGSNQVTVGSGYTDPRGLIFIE